MRAEKNNIIKDFFVGKNVAYHQLSEEECYDLTVRVLNEYVGDEKRESMMLNLKRSPNRQKVIEYHKYFANPGSQRVENYEEDILERVSNNGRSECFVFWNTPAWGALRFEANTLKDIELSYFSEGYICSLQLDNIVAVTLDNEVLELNR